MIQKYYWLLATFLLMVFSCNDNGPIEKEELISQISNCSDEVENPMLAECKILKNAYQTEIWTWNLEFFPLDGNTQQSVVEILEYYQPDIVAFQEINNKYRFQEVMEALSIYEGWVADISGNLHLAYAYNTCTVTSISEPTTKTSTELYPRAALHWNANVQGETIELINLHLKCCNDGVETRTASINKLKEYMLGEKPEEKIILLGDYNDELEDTSMKSLRDDSVNFRFLDQHISQGSQLNWSYPGWPSHIDHILISNDLFDESDTAYTVLLDQCISGYSRIVSDHRPVAATFTF
jgi:endonuclease/exonuclease/phosphatase family metal-dependent hydrolase